MMPVKVLLISSLVVPMVLGACSKGSKKQGEQESYAVPATSETMRAALVGLWEEPCSTDKNPDKFGNLSFKSSNTFEANGRAVASAWTFSDAACAKPRIHSAYSYQFKVGSAVGGQPGVFELDLTDAKLDVELLEDATGIEDACTQGRTTLKPNVPSQCPDIDVYQIAKIEGDRLLLGSSEGEDATSSAAKRPVVLDTRFVFTKTK